MYFFSSHLFFHIMQHWHANLKRTNEKKLVEALKNYAKIAVRFVRIIIAIGFYY